MTETVPLGFRQTAPAAPGTASAALNVSQARVTGLLFGNQALAAPATISGHEVHRYERERASRSGGAGRLGRRDPAPGEHGVALPGDDGGRRQLLFRRPRARDLHDLRNRSVGFTQTAPGGAGTFSVTVAAGDVRSDLLFGDRPSGALSPGSVSGTKMLDLNRMESWTDRSALEGITSF